MFRRFVPIILITLTLICGISYIFWIWRYDAFPWEKRIAKDIELASLGPLRVNADADYCIPNLTLPVCSMDLLENSAPGTPCFIQKCSWGHVTTLNLYGGQLEDLPATIARLPGLTELNLHDNNLTRLPSEIGKLSRLTRLDLSGNQLTELPTEIGRLTNLQKLDVSANRLTALPQEVGQLSSLTYLNIGNNPLTGPLPRFLFQLVQLKRIIFSATQLCMPQDAFFEVWINSISDVEQRCSPQSGYYCNMPEEEEQALLALYEMPGHPTNWDLNKNRCFWSGVSCSYSAHIKGLDLSTMNIGELPPEFWQLRYLKDLNLTNTQLSDLPPGIGNLQNLTHLYLGANQLTQLPPEIGQLANLTKLVLDHNRFTSLPAEIGQLQNLTSLTLFGNRLESLPEEIGQLTHLSMLDVSNNPLRGPLPLFLTHLPEVQFIFSNTGLCVPNTAEVLNWLGRQAKGVYTYSESGELVYKDVTPDDFISWFLENQGCN